jgi:hypothetical protein
MADHDHPHAPRPHCCPCASHDHAADGISRRMFLGGAALGGIALSGLSWSTLVAAEPELPAAPARQPLVVKPLFLYHTYQARPQTSWRPWGGIETQAQADEEQARIAQELEQLKKQADFPVEFLPIAPITDSKQLENLKDLGSADALLVYAVDGDLNAVAQLGKNTIFFVRHKSGPLYVNYEIISPGFLRQHTDKLAVKSFDYDDVVVDSQDEILWRLRALCGLRNTVGAKILALGGPAAWAQPRDVVPNLVRDLWKMDIQTISYEELGGLIEAARKDDKEVALAKRRADEYLKLAGTSLETDRKFLDNAMLLEQIFRRLMAKAGCRAFTINNCMSTIMPKSETTACMPLSTLNDDGYLAFCESDFVVIPSGMLAGAISGNPTFLNDPTYPHDDIITLAHCTGPRKMDGKTVEPVRILTHFESDYGAAPKVEMRKGQTVTNIIPDFASKRWVGFLGEIVDHPFLPICRSQIDVRFTCGVQKVAENMPGFHWMTIYGDYHRELGYALKKVPITWEWLG